MIIPAKPCPFCNGTEIEYQRSANTQPEGLPVNAICCDCGATGPVTHVPVSSTNEEIEIAAIGQWNTRPLT